jgi:glycosyltransferase involved in cell wall biosynthesis
MRCPTLSELPPPPPDRTGWPWAEESPQLPDTIRSVLLQGYPNLEYIIVDGGSADESVDIVRRYEPWLAYWISEPDRGQSHAINKGFREAAGDILAWLNSDDVYWPGILRPAAVTFQQHPQAGLVYGRTTICDQGGKPLGRPWGQPFDLAGVFRGVIPVPQPSAFFRRSVFDRVGELDESLRLVMDTELWLRLGLASQAVFVDEVWSNFRYYPQSKSGQGRLPFVEEWYDVICRAFETWPLPDRLYRQRKSTLARLLIQLAHEHHELADYTKGRLYAFRALFQDPGVLKDAQLRDCCLRYLIGRQWALRLKSLKMRIQMVGR